MGKDYKKNLDKDVSTLLKEFIDKNIPNRNLKMFTGKIEDNLDPLKLGRCKIRVYGIFDNLIPLEDLPWAIPENNNIGGFIVPSVGNLIRVYFDNDDIYTPVYTSNIVNTDQLSTLKDEDYPNNLILLETENGDYVILNRKTLEFEFHHASGSSIKIDEGGSIYIDNTGSDDGNFEISIEGDVSIVSETGDVSVSAPTGNVKLGGDDATQNVNNLPACILTGSPHCIGKQFQGTPGSVQVPS